MKYLFDFLYFIPGFLYKIFMVFFSSVKAGSGLRIKGIPMIHIWYGSRLEIGQNVVLNSQNRGYHLNMYRPVKLFSDKKSALIKIGDNTRIHGSCIHAMSKVEIGSNCLIAANCQIMDVNGHELSMKNARLRIFSKDDPKPVRIEDNVWIGSNSMVLPGSHICAGSVITANSVVRGYIPPNCLAGGVPAKVIRSYKDN